MAKYTIDNFMGGIAPSDRMGGEGTYAVGDYIDPFREPGYLLPGFSPSSIKDSDTANFDNSVIRKIVPSWFANAAFIIDSGDKIHTSTLNNDVFTVADNTVSAAGTHSSGGHTSFKLRDFIVYNLNGTDFGFYSYNDSADGDIGRTDLSGTYDDDYFSSTVTSASVLTNNIPHPMVLFENDQKLYIGNGRDVISMTSDSTPTADMTALQLPQGWLITHFTQTENYIVIGAVQDTANGGIDDITTQRPRRLATFWWDGVSSGWNRFFSINDWLLNGLYNLDGTIFALTGDANGGGVLRIFDGSGFKKIREIKDSSDNKLSFFGSDISDVLPQIMNTYRNRIILGSVANSTSDLGGLYAYGKFSEGFNSGLYLIGNAGGSHNIISAVAQIEEDKIYVGANDASNNKTSIIKLDSNFDTNATWKSLWVEAPQTIRVNYIKFHFKTLAANQNATVQIETNYGNNTFTLGTITNSSDGAIEFKRFNFNRQCENFRIIIDHDTSASDAIRFSKIVVDYDIVDDLG